MAHDASALGHAVVVAIDAAGHVVRRAVASEFARAFYRALRPGQPAGDAYDAWRTSKEEEGAADLERFVNDWAELRACLEVAAANRLDVALLFYA